MVIGGSSFLDEPSVEKMEKCLLSEFPGKTKSDSSLNWWSSPMQLFESGIYYPHATRDLQIHIFILNPTFESGSPARPIFLAMPSRLPRILRPSGSVVWNFWKSRCWRCWNSGSDIFFLEMVKHFWRCFCKLFRNGVETAILNRSCDCL